VRLLSERETAGVGGKPWFGGFYPWLFEAMGIFKPGMRVADVGCGPGRVTAGFVGKVKSYHGIDRNGGAIKFAKERFPDFRFDVVDLAKERDEQLFGPADLVVGTSIFTHLSLKSIKRTLRLTTTAPTAVYTMFFGEPMDEKHTRTRYPIDIFTAAAEESGWRVGKILMGTDFILPIANHSMQDMVVLRRLVT
jgi:SAM-dependent methyltransferase